MSNETETPKFTPGPWCVRPYVDAIDIVTMLEVITELQAENARLRVENARLHAIVDRLPKTADGVVLFEGDDAWWIIGGQTAKLLCFLRSSLSYGVPVAFFDGGRHSLPYDRLYSTEAAALAAMKGDAK